MRIGIDAHFTSYELRGIGKYVLHLVTALVRSDSKNRYVIYGPSKAFPELHGLPTVEFHNPGSLPYPIWEQVFLPRWISRDGVDLLHCPANTGPLFLPRRIKLVVTIHDVMFLLSPAVLPPSKVPRQRMGNLYRRAVVPRVARRADRILTDSEFSKAQITAHLRIDPRIIRVTYMGVNPRTESSPLSSFSAPDCFAGRKLEHPFILVLGSGDPRKNTPAIIRAYAAVCRKLPSQERLVVLGLRNWRSSPAYKLTAQLGIEDLVFFADYVPEDDLIWFYQSACCLLYPTLYEGFGLPALEAMAFGVPVIASNTASVPEVAGDAALLVDPTAEDSIANAIQLVLQDIGLRKRLVERGRVRVAKFRWDGVAERTLAAYLETVEGTQLQPY